jgi:DNA-binding MarR family transcriptional regulator
MESQELQNANHKLESLFFLTSHLIETAFQKALRRKHISPQISIILVAISRMSNPSPIQLSRNSGRKPQTITAMIKRMEKLGLVEKVINEGKKNTYKILLTRKGTTVCQKIQEINIFYRVIQALSETERYKYIEYLEKMNAQIKKLRL